MIRVTSEQVTFSQVPHWVLEGSSHAVKLYCVLIKYADNSSRMAHPSRPLLAADMGFKDAKSLDPIIAELEAMGAMTVVRQKSGGRNAVNQYHMLRSQKFVPQDVVGEPDPLFENIGSGIGDSDAKNRGAQSLGIGEPDPLELEPLNYNQELDKSAADADAADSPEIVDAVVEELLGTPEDRIAKAAYDATRGAYGYMPVRQIAKWAINANYAPEDVEAVIAQLWRSGKPLTKALVGQTLEGIIRPGQRVNRADQRDADSMDLLQRIRAKDAQDAQREIAK